jgi:hypothetical protein
MSKCCQCYKEFDESKYPICENCFVKYTRTVRTYFEEGRREGAIAERIKTYQDLLKFDGMINCETATYLRTQIKLLKELE